MLSAKYVNGKDLRTQIGVLNDSGALGDTKLKTVGVKKDIMLAEFMKTVNEVPEGSEAEKKIPDSVLNFFNQVVEGKDEDYAGREKEKKPKAPRQSSNEQAAYDMLSAGFTYEQILEEYRARYTAKGKTDEEFLTARTKIYVDIAKRKLKSEGKTDVLPDWVLEEDRKKEEKKAAEKAAAEKKAAEKAAEKAAAEKAAAEKAETEDSEAAPEEAEAAPEEVEAEAPKKGRRQSKVSE